MIPSPLLRGAAVAALAALAITWPGMVSAQAQAQPRESAAQTSLSGSYLAARHAGDQRDVAAAASYYRAALRGDPRNNELLGRTFLAVLANGEVDEGVKLAERVLQVDKNDRIARLVLGVRALKQKQSGGTPLEKGAELAVFLGSSRSDGITGKLISAVWDPWASLPEHLDELSGSDIYTLRRIVPKDRGKTWGGEQ